MTMSIHDPVEAPAASLPGLAELGDRVLLDPRDLPFLELIVQLHLVMVPLAVAMFFVEPFRWWYGAIYLAILLLVFLDRFILMIHNLAHRPTFRKPHRWVHTSLDWLIGPLFGHTPHTYYVHHIGMHHVEGNAPEDRSSTERFQRDSIFDFGRYLFRFYFLGIADMASYLGPRKRTKLMRRMLKGELLFFVVTFAALAWKPLPALFVLVLPLLITRFLMMAGNWGQHAFIDETRPDNSYVNSITCINSRYNRRAFNDGYHIAHHLFPRMHWTELPRELVEHKESYVAEGAIVFEGIDFFLVWGALMLKQYGWLARCYVQLDGSTPDHAKIAELLRSRTKPLARAVNHAR
jgi:fatty acid desaturase